MPPEPFAAYGLIADQLPTVNPQLQVDTLWVLFHSLAALACWTSADQSWANLVVSGWNPDDGPEPEEILSDRHDAENELLLRIGHDAGSPWLFGIHHDR
ncbi:MAG: hypothetical protein ACLQFR_28585 [Streptosporangiaceae bacterium]